MNVKNELEKNTKYLKEAVEAVLIALRQLERVIDSLEKIKEKYYE